MNKFHYKHFLFILFFAISACGPTYRYDAASGLCRNKNGDVGYNKDSIEECGLVSGEKNDYRDFKASKGENLSGLRIENTDLRNSNFSGTNLTGALFISDKKKQTSLSKALFKNANLSGVEFDIHYSDMAGQTNLSGATINEHTVFPGLYFDFHGPNSAQDYGISVLGNGVNFSFSNSDATPELKSILSNSMQASHKALAYTDFARLRGGLYSTTGDSEIFGGPASQDAFQFVNSRVGYWTSSYEAPGVIAFNVTTGLFLRTLKDDFKKDADRVFSNLNQSGSALPHLSLPPARGIDLDSWQNQAVLTSSGQTPSFRINGSTFTLDSHSDGGVGAFSNSYMNMEIPQLKRLSTLVHESRHSECRIPVRLAQTYENLVERLSLVDAEVNQIRLNKTQGKLSDLEMNQLIEAKFAGEKGLFDEIKVFANLVFKDKKPDGSPSYDMVDCGFDHIDCPLNHPTIGLQGLEGACDDNPVGAYGVGYKFLVSVAEDCPSCKAVEREQARIKAADSLDRYVGDDFPELIRERDPGPQQMGFPKINLDGI